MNKKNILVIVILSALFIALVWFQHYMGEVKKKRTSFPTTYDTGKNGYKAFYLLLKDMGYRVRRFEKSPEKLKDDNITSLIVIRSDYKNLTGEKARAIYDWVSEGNQLVIADQYDSEFWKLLSIEAKLYPAISGKVLTKFDKNPATRNVKSLQVNDFNRLDLPSPESYPFTVYLKDEGGVICASTRIGRGRIFILSAPLMFDNNYIKEKDNAIFITNFISLLNTEDIAFDEFISGKTLHIFSPEMLPTFNAITIQVIMTVLIFYSVFLIRFGKPRSIFEDTIRASNEYIYSLAGLFSKAGSKLYALENILHNFKRRIARTYSFSPEVSDEKIIDTLKSLKTKDEGKVIQILEKCIDSIEKGDISDGEFSKHCYELEQIVRYIQNRDDFHSKRRF